jgi:hypothetical protein
MQQEPDPDEEGHHPLEADLGPGGEPQVAHLADFGVVVPKADGAEAQQAEQRHPDVRVPQVGPQQRGDDDGDEDQHPAHGGRARLLVMRFRAVLADVLADLELAQLADQPRPQGDGEKQGGEAGKRRPEGGVLEDAERAEVRVKSLK